MAPAAIIVAMLAFGAAMFLVIPLIARRDLFFGVTVPPSFHDDPAGRRIMRRYRLEVVLHATIAAVLSVASLTSSSMGAVQPLAVFWLLGGTGFSFARAHRAVLPYSASAAAGGIREAELTPRGSLPGGVLAWTGPFLLLGAGAAWAAAPGSAIGVFTPAIMGLIACTLSLGLAYSILHQSRPLRVSGEEGRQEDRVRRANLLFLLGNQYLMAVMCSGLTTMLPLANSPRGLTVFMVGAAAVVAVATILIARMRRNVPVSGSLGDTTPDDCWKWGLFYYNRADPALWVEQRVGLGWTLNLGHTAAWFIMGAMLAAPLFFAVVLPLLLAARR